ncbi:serine/threonine-protein kinase [Candidatus Laterigemmans baculatus]|uniref:serine/threonine-protein kinase n=1 Tax=Candidatus Laterigemmans baculatus TaxID=2770505 RepID=UPI0013DAC52A|nr:serine/threonine-protein kinase [Candidatus Laterigemmans baculatus]
MNAPTPSRSGSSSGPAQIASTDLTGRRLGDLQILRRLGRGGMADVYVANQSTLGRRVALKVLRRDLAVEASYVERFRREARAAAKLTHPNIVQIYEVGCTDSMHYISQEYVDGLNLRQQLDRSGPLSVEQAVVVMRSVAEALSAASAEGIVHRDIKPENVMINSRGEVKVADFGLARVIQGEPEHQLTQVGMTMGTPLYMSPEQVQGRDVDVRSDLYSLGVMMYHLLVGRPPFEADTPLALAVKHLHDTPPPLPEARPEGDLPQWLVVAVERLMEKSPEKRFATPAQLGEYLSRAMQESGAPGGAAAALHSRIDATRTLQRLMREEPQPRSVRRAVLRFAAITLPLLAFVAGFAMAGQGTRPDVEQLLQRSDFTVERKGSAAEQYLEAARLNEPEAWRKVAEYFPPEESPINAAYAVKSQIQLARYYRELGQYRQSQRELQTLLSDATLAGIHRAVALAELLQTQTAAGFGADAKATREELRAQYQNLQATPAQQKIFDRVVPQEILRTLKP